MRILNSIKLLLLGLVQASDATPEQLAEARRVHRRITKFPRFRNSPNPQAHRTALFKERYGIA